MHQFRVWAPKASTVAVKIEKDEFPLAQAGGGWWQAQIAQAGPGTDYLYIVDGEEPAVPDPRSAWQPAGVHGPSRIVDHSAFAWSDAGWRTPAFPSAIVYELHIGTFTLEGTFDAAIAKLDWLAPYEPYGGPDGLKRLVDAAHGKGLAMLLDVVYNHFGPDGNYTGKFGPYLTRLHTTPWGDAVNFEDAGSHEVRRFFIDNALMWLRDYHFDGLRMDAVTAYMDRSALNFMEQLAGE